MSLVASTQPLKTHAYSLLCHIPQAYDPSALLACWLILATAILKVLITCTSLSLAAWYGSFHRILGLSGCWNWLVL